MTASIGAERAAADLDRADGGSPGADATATADESAGRGSDGVSQSTRYRYLIPLVKQMDTPTTIDLFVDPMLRWENELTEGESTKSWADVHEELYLVDLPVLDRMGVIEFDRSVGLVAVDGE